MPHIYSGSLSEKVSEREIAGREIARKIAEEGIVLLHNNGVLPIKEKSHIALFGAGARKTVKGGSGSGDVNERETVSVYQGLFQKGYYIDSEEWLDAYDKLYEESRRKWKEEILRLGAGNDEKTIQAYVRNPFRVPEKKITEIDKIKERKTAIYVISRMAGEGADRKDEPGDYRLTEAEQYNIDILIAAFESVIIVVNSGGLIDLSYIDTDRVAAILLLAQPGMEGGNALANIISGQISPSGKLADTIPYQLKDYVSMKDCCDTEKSLEYYREGIFVGYKYYDRKGIKPRYPLGFGMSYTTFDIKFNQCKLRGQKIVLKVLVKNTGKQYAGKEVIQVYAYLPEGKLLKEKKRLVGFRKTSLIFPGEEVMLELEIDPEYLKSYDEDLAQWVIEKGNYILAVGNSSSNSNKIIILRYERDVVLKKVSNRCTPEMRVQELFAEGNYDCGENRLPILDMPCGGVPGDGEENYKEQFQPELYNEICQLSDEELAYLVIGSSQKSARGTIGAASHSVPGAAGETTSLFDKAPLYINKMVMADGPAGLRLRKCYYVNADGEILKTGMLDSIENGIFSSKQRNTEDTPYYQFCTALPVGTMIAMTYNEDLAGIAGELIGNEMEEFGIDIWLAPGMNIHRNLLCGRNFEYYSEDPVITGKIASAVVKGVQKRKNKCACIKHFACNNTEYNRKMSNSIINEKALREEYLMAFEIVVKEAFPKLVMSSYNKINGTYAANNRDLCTGILREEWNFDGLVISDWTTTGTGGADAALCIQAGNDLIMPGYESDYEEIIQSVHRERKEMLDKKNLQISAYRVAKLARSCKIEDASCE